MSLALIKKLRINRNLLKCCVERKPCSEIYAVHRAYGSRGMVPASNVERVSIDGRDYRSVREGSASILAPFTESEAPKVPGERPRNNDEGEQAVFYNPIQQFNRDLSVLAILIYGEGAVLRKQENFRNKTHGAKKRTVNSLKHNPTTKTNGEGEHASSLVEGQPSKKRKVSEIAPETDVIDAKRLRAEYENAEDGDLEVQQLEGNAQVNEDDKKTSSEATVDTNTVESGPNTSAADGVTSNAPQKISVGFTILDALSATGLRALRYAKEIPFATTIIANDISSDAVKSINLNIKHNDLSDIVHSNVGDARAFMYSKVGNEHRPAAGKYVHRFDIIDLDPYGTAAPFFDAAVQALQDGGLLCVTCTDAGVFASNGYPEKAYALYGGLPLKGPFSHEGGLRLILHAVATSAAKYGISIEPLLSLSIDFYARLFIRVHKQQKDVKLLAGTTMIVYNCDQGCGAWNTQLMAKNQARNDKKGDLIFKHGFAQGPSVNSTCEHCGFKTHIGGPMWAGPLHNPYFVQRILDRLPSLDKSTYQTLDRLQGMLTLALEEDLTLSSSNEKTTDSNPSEGKSSETAPSPQLSSTEARVIPRLPPDTIDQSPFFFIPNYAAKVLHCQTPSEDEIRGAIRHLGYRVTRSHCKPGSFRTTAPWSVIWEIMREWVRTKKPIKEDAIKAGTAGWAILGNFRGTERKMVKDRKEALATRLQKCETLEDMKLVLEAEMYKFEYPPKTSAASGTDGTVQMKAGEEAEATGAKPPSAGINTSKLKIVFDEKLGREKPRGKLVRYQINPRANWGPMNRASGNS